MKFRGGEFSIGTTGNFQPELTEPATFGATDRVLVMVLNLSPYFSVVLGPSRWARLGITGIVFEYVFEYAFERG